MLLSGDLKKVIFIKLISCSANLTTERYVTQSIAHVCIDTLLIRFIVKCHFEEDFLNFCDLLKLSKKFKRMMRFGPKHLALALNHINSLASHKGILKTGLIRKLLNIGDCSSEYSDLLKKVSRKRYPIDELPFSNNLKEAVSDRIMKQSWKEEICHFSHLEQLIDLKWLLSFRFESLFDVH